MQRQSTAPARGASEEAHLPAAALPQGPANQEGTPDLAHPVASIPPDVANEQVIPAPSPPKIIRSAFREMRPAPPKSRLCDQKSQVSGCIQGLVHGSLRYNLGVSCPMNGSKTTRPVWALPSPHGGRKTRIATQAHGPPTLPRSYRLAAAFPVLCLSLLTGLTLNKAGQPTKISNREEEDDFFQTQRRPDAQGDRRTGRQGR